MAQELVDLEMQIHKVNTDAKLLQFFRENIPSIQLKTATRTPATDKPKTALKHEYNALWTIVHSSDESNTKRTATETKTKTLNLAKSKLIETEETCIKVDWKWFMADSFETNRKSTELALLLKLNVLLYANINNENIKLKTWVDFENNFFVLQPLTCVISFQQ